MQRAALNLACRRHRPDCSLDLAVEAGGGNTRTGCLDGMASMRRRRIAAEEHPHLGQVGVEGARARSHCCAPAQTRVFKGNPLEILEKRGHEGPGANPGNRTPWVHKVSGIETPFCERPTKARSHTRHPQRATLSPECVETKNTADENILATGPDPPASQTRGAMPDPVSATTNSTAYSPPAYPYSAQKQPHDLHFAARRLRPPCPPTRSSRLFRCGRILILWDSAKPKQDARRLGPTAKISASLDAFVSLRPCSCDLAGLWCQLFHGHN